MARPTAGQLPTALHLEHRPGDDAWEVTFTYTGAAPSAPTAGLVDSSGAAVAGVTLNAAVAGQVVTLTLTGTPPVGRHAWFLEDQGLTHLAGDFTVTYRPRRAVSATSVAVEVATGATVTVETPSVVGGGGGSITASEILTAVKTVDGAGSGLDADLLDGQHASAFLTPLWAQAVAAGQAVEIGNGTQAVAIWAEAGGPSIGSKDDSRLLVEAQARWDSDDDGVEGTGIDINRPAIVLRQTGEDHKGAMLEMQQYLAAGTHTYGSATNAAGGTFNVGVAGYKRVGWILAHYDSPNPVDGIHQHMNFETVQADLSTIVTRFQISWGEDIALASFPNSHVRFYDDKEVQLGSDRDVVLKFDTAQSRVVVTGATWRFGSGATSVWIDVTNGRLGVGPAVSAPSAPLHLERADDGQSILARNTVVGGNTGAVIKAETQTSGSRVFQSGIQTTDSTARFSIETSGKMEWGAGSASARDTNLYRSAADTLKTDDNLVVGGTLTIGADTVQEVIRDTMGTALVAGSNVTITPTDGADTITIAASGGGSLDLTALTALTGASVDNDDDLMLIYDASATANKKISFEEVVRGMGALGLLPGDSPIQGGYFPLVASSLTTSTLGTSGYMHVARFARRVTCDRIGIEVTAAVAASTARLGIYGHNPTTGGPGTLILDAGTVDCSTTGWKEITISQAVGPGLVFLAVSPSSGSIGFRVNSGAAPATAVTSGYRTDGQVASQYAPSGVYSNSLASAGAFPSTVTPASSGAVTPRILVRIA